MGDANESLGYAIGKITEFCPCEDTGAHVELTYLGCENEFYRWYIEHEGDQGALPKGYSHHLCRRALTTCMRKEGRKMIHVQKWSAITKEDASWGAGLLSSLPAGADHSNRPRGAGGIRGGGED